MNKRYFKWVALLLVVVMVFAVTAIGCTGGNGGVPKLKVFTWVGYEDPNFWNNPSDPYAFYAIYDEDEIEVEHTFYLDPYNAYSQLTVDPTYADVIEVYAYHMNLWNDPENPLIEPLDTELLPLWDEVSTALGTWPGASEGGELLMAPKYFGNSFMMHRTDLLLDAGFAMGDFANNLSFLFTNDPALNGKIYYYDSGDESLPFLLSGALMLAVEAGDPRVAHLAPEDIEEAIWTDNMTEFDTYSEILKEYWLAASDNVGGFWTGWEDAIDKLITGEAWLLNGWNDAYMWVALGLEESLNITDGRNAIGYMSGDAMWAWLGGWSVRAGLQEDDPVLWEAAHVYINAHLSKPSGIYMIEEWAYGTGNEDAAVEAEPYAPWLVEEFDYDDPATIVAEQNLYGVKGYETHLAWAGLWEILKGLL